MLMKTLKKKTCVGDFTRKDFYRTKVAKLFNYFCNKKKFKTRPLSQWRIFVSEAKMISTIEACKLFSL